MFKFTQAMDCLRRTCPRIRCLKRHILPTSNFSPKTIQTTEVRSNLPNSTYIKGAPHIEEADFEDIRKKIDDFYAYKEIEEMLNQSSEDEDEVHTSDKQLKSIKSQ